MRIVMLEHDPVGFSLNVLSWVTKNNHPIHRITISETDRMPLCKDFDWLIVAGGIQHAWDESIHPWLRIEKRLIAKAAEQEKFILGICLGAQLLAEVLGAKVFPNPNKEVGWHEVRLTLAGRDSPFFNNVPKRFTIFHWHNDHFSLPPGCLRLAYNTTTKNQAFIDKNGRFLGIQFHPDYDCKSIIQMIQNYDEEWPKGPFVTKRDELIRQTRDMREPAWLMTCLLDNISQFV
jgi:GMP synthase (glutamine-hydrolysing)